jgi:hypothetical protein
MSVVIAEVAPNENSVVTLSVELSYCGGDGLVL